uniref:Uncharacterized LOC105925527 n=1 Tax=Fundulus heteroclitus TaxID=8078 RepID=A0A3Q2SUN0_FUNHE
MMNFTLIGALLCSFSWIPTSVCQFYTMLVQPGEEAILRCANLSIFPTFLHWFKLTEKPNASIILSMSLQRNNLSSNKLQRDRFTMTTNTTDLFLNIRTVDFSDAGLYFCGPNTEGNPGIFSATYLQVEGDVCDEVTNVPTVILGAITFFLVILIILMAAKIGTYLRAQLYPPNQSQTENLNSDNLTYAAPCFHPKAQSNRRPVAERELEKTVVYAATR